MYIHQIEPIAQQIINAISPLVGGRTLNIMDLNGVIIASSDPKRLGTFHQGAAQVVASGQVVRIRSDELYLYPGAREGINLPIVREGNLLGVVGIYGQPDEVEDAANLLCVCVGLYLEQEAESRRRQQQKDVRCGLLKTLMLSEHCSEAELTEAGYDPQRLKLPSRAAVVALPANIQQDECIRILEQAETTLLVQGILSETQDIYGMINHRLVLLLHTRQEPNRLYTVLQAALQQPFSVSVGLPAAQWDEVKFSYREAVALCRLKPKEYSNAADCQSKLLYLMDSVRTQAQRRIVEPMYQTLLAYFGENDISWAMETVRAYYQTGGSTMRAAQQMHIHKNTLIYRVRKVTSLLGLEEADAFTREYLLRLLLIYHDTRTVMGR